MKPVKSVKDFPQLSEVYDLVKGLKCGNGITAVAIVHDGGKKWKAMSHSI